MKDERSLERDIGFIRRMNRRRGATYTSSLRLCKQVFGKFIDRYSHGRKTTTKGIQVDTHLARCSSSVAPVANGSCWMREASERRSLCHHHRLVSLKEKASLSLQCSHCMSLTVDRGRFLQSIFPMCLPIRRGMARLKLLTDDMRQRQSDQHSNEELHIVPIDHARRRRRTRTHPSISINCFLSI